MNEANHDENQQARVLGDFRFANGVWWHGPSDRLAKDRRTRLAEHVIEAGIVTLADIDAAGN